MDTTVTAIRAALGLAEGHLLDWGSTGCQLVSAHFRSLLSCPYREAVWQCEVIGPHTVHRWSDHLKAHERAGNGWRCSEIGAPSMRVTHNSLANTYVGKSGTP